MSIAGVEMRLMFLLCVRENVSRKWSAQQQQVVFRFAQRRHEDREHVQPVVQILAERSVGDRLLEVLVGGR
jgi:hypothetical protein